MWQIYDWPSVVGIDWVGDFIERDNESSFSLVGVHTRSQDVNDDPEDVLKLEYREIIATASFGFTQILCGNLQNLIIFKGSKYKGGYFNI